MDVQFQAIYGGMKIDPEGAAKLTLVVDASSVPEMAKASLEWPERLLTVKVSNG